VRRSAWIAGSWLIALLHAHAQDALPLELQWRAPAECPSAADVRAELARIARARPGSVLTPLSADVEVQRRSSAYALTLQTVHAGEHGERQLEATDCKTLLRTLTLILALSYGAGVEMADETAPPAREQPSKAAQRAATEAAPPPSAAAPRPERAGAQPAAANTAPGARDGRNTELAVWLGGGVQLGLLPTAALATTAGIEWRPGAWSLGLQLTAWPLASSTGIANVEARFDGLAGALQACRRLPLAPFTLGLCAGAQAAALRGRSVGATSDGSSVAPWYALLAATTLSWPRDSWLAGRLEAGLAGSLDRPLFSIEGVGPVHRVPAVVGEFDVQLLVTL
jgi:hypothetical protein